MIRTYCPEGLLKDLESDDFVRNSPLNVAFKELRIREQKHTWSPDNPRYLLKEYSLVLNLHWLGNNYASAHTSNLRHV